jgi:hypothetical protein
MKLVICHGEAISNNIKNIHKTDPIINKENNIVAELILLLIRNSLHLINVIINSNAKIVIS